MAFVTWLARSKYGRWLALAVVFVLALVGVYVKINDDAEDRVEANGLREQLRGDERGRNAVAKEREATRGASADDLVERLRSRDGDWW